MGEIKKASIFTITEESSDITLFDCRWIPCSTRFVVVGTDTKGHGILKVYTIKDSSKVSELVSIERKRHPFKCLTYGATSLEDRQAATGDFDGNINLWDVENKQSVWSVKGHSTIVNAIDGIGGNTPNSEEGTPLIVTGSRDGTVKVWDVRVKERASACMKPIEGTMAHDCWTVAFGRSNLEGQVVAAGFDNGDIKVFDLRAMTTYWETHVHTGVCSVTFDSSVHPIRKICATGLQGSIHLWNWPASSQNRNSSEWTDKTDKNKQTVWGVRYLKQNRDIIATYDGSGAIKVWKHRLSKESVLPSDCDNGHTKGLEKLHECQISKQPISSFDWSPDMPGLAVSTSFDQKVRLLAFTNMETL